MLSKVFLGHEGSKVPDDRLRHRLNDLVHRAAGSVLCFRTTFANPSRAEAAGLGRGAERDEQGRADGVEDDRQRRSGARATSTGCGGGGWGYVGPGWRAEAAQ